MLETFGNLEVQYKVQDTDEFKTKKIPIKYSTREKLNLFDDIEEEQLLSGNLNILPRTTIALSTIVKNSERQSNKFVKISTTEFGEFFFNSVAYDFTFDMSVMCRGMNEASSIIEQVTTRFNPNYTILINEIPNQIKPTSVPIQLLDIGIETQEYDSLSQDIITLSFGFNLKGNFYSPIEQIEKIKNVNMYLNLWHTSVSNEYSRAKLFEYDILDNVVSDVQETVLVQEGEFGTIVPVVLDIIVADSTDNTDISVEVGTPLILEAIFEDKDNKLNELSFSWNLIGNGTLTKLDNAQAELIGNSTEVLEVQLMVSDIHGNTSNLFSKNITII